MDSNTNTPEDKEDKTVPLTAEPARIRPLISIEKIEGIIDRGLIDYFNDKREGGFRRLAKNTVFRALEAADVKVDFTVTRTSEDLEEGEAALDQALTPIVDAIESGLNRIVSRHSLMKRITYRCTSTTCAKRMKLFFFPEESIPMWINCDWCKAGRNMAPQDQERKNVGMKADHESLVIIEHYEDGHEEVRKEEATVTTGQGTGQGQGPHAGPHPVDRNQGGIATRRLTPKQ